MHYSLQWWDQSNFLVTITFTNEELLAHKETALKQFQKDAKIEWFRPWHAPLSMVEQQISPEYLKVAMYEEALHTITNQMLSEHPDKKFIWQMYNLNIDEAKEWQITMTFVLDVYPDTSAKNDAWMKLKIDPISSDASDAEVDETLYNLKRQYANYKEASEIGPDSVFKVSLRFLDKSGTEVHTGKLYLGKEDVDEFPQLKTYFMGKKEWEEVSIAYDEKQLPPTMYTKKEWITATSIQATVWDIKDMELPEFTGENLKKFFGNEDVKTEAELKEKIRSLVAAQKEESLLMQAIDAYLQWAMKSFGLVIPKTLIDEEVKTRMKTLEERMGGEEWLKKYFEQIGEEETKKLHTTIRDAANNSLGKFLILREIVEKLEIKDVNREAHLDVEKKLYEKIRK